MAKFDSNEFHIFYLKISNVLRQFCILHSNLLDATITEYDFLLESEIDGVDEISQLKEEIVQMIHLTDEQRKTVLYEAFESGLFDKPVEGLGDLEILLIPYEKDNDITFFSEFSELLIKIIDNLKNQNKKNQIYLHKALESLQDLRSNMTGRTSSKIYNPKGVTALVGQEG
jgi:flagellar biosynthesis/type III secretory pathway chaperone